MGSTANAETDRSGIDDIDWLESATYGAGAWVAGYLILLVGLALVGVYDGLGGEGPSPLAVVSAVLYSGSLGAFTGGTTGPIYISSMTYGEGIVYSVANAVQLLVPALVLLVAGAMVAGKYTDHARPTVLLAGASVAVGYDVLVLLSQVVFFVPSLGASYSPVGVVVAGVLYPAVFGSIGAAMRIAPRLRVTGRHAYGVGAFLLGLAAWYLVGTAGSGQPISNHYALHRVDDILALGTTYAYHHGTLYPVYGGGVFHEYTFGWLPAVVTLVAGALVVERAARPASLTEAIFDGATIARGYAVIVTALVLARLAAVGVADSGIIMRIRDILPPILFTGIVWPFMWGAVGGGIVYLLGRYTGRVIDAAEMCDDIPKSQAASKTNEDEPK